MPVNAINAGGQGPVPLLASRFRGMGFPFSRVRRREYVTEPPGRTRAAIRLAAEETVRGSGQTTHVSTARRYAGSPCFQSYAGRIYLDILTLVMRVREGIFNWTRYF